MEKDRRLEKDRNFENKDTPRLTITYKIIIKSSELKAFKYGTFGQKIQQSQEIFRVLLQCQ